MRESQVGIQKQVKNDVIEVDLARVSKALLHSVWLIVIAAMLCGSLAYLGTKFFVTPTYRTYFTVYVNNRDTTESTTSVSNSDLSASRSLATTYANIIKSRSVLTEAALAAGLDYSYSQLNKFVSVGTVDSTEILRITVTMENPEEALLLANAIVTNVPVVVMQIVSGSSVEIIDVPVMPDGIYAPNYRKNAIIGVVFGIAAAVVLIILRELMDDTINDTSDLEKRFGIAIIGTIPDLTAKSTNRYGYGYGAASRQNGKGN